MGSRLLSLLGERTVILDGATGTELIARGLSPGDCPERWNLIHPYLVSEVHKSYYEAGSDIVFANTFGANRLKLKPYGLDSRVTDINKAASQILREVCPDGFYAGGDIGPTGKFLKPSGEYEREEFEEIFEEQAQALKAGGVDLISIETMYDLEEARCALKAALKTGLPVFVSLTFNKKKRGFFTLMGNTPQESFRILKSEGAAAVGTNCSLESGDMLLLVEELKDIGSFSLITKPNAGKPRMIGDKVEYDTNPDEFAAAIGQMVDRGARIVGGCCGTSPGFIKRISSLVKKEKSIYRLE